MANPDGNTQKASLLSRLDKSVTYIGHNIAADLIIHWDSGNLSIPQYRALHFLNQSGPSKMGEIAKCLGRPLSATTSLADMLETKGCITRIRDTADRRVVICKITPRGRAEVDALLKKSRCRISAGADALSVDELNTIVQGLEALEKLHTLRD